MTLETVTLDHPTINLGLIPKEQRVITCVNSVSQLKVGQSAEFSLPFLGGPKADEVFVGIKQERPDVLVAYDDKTRTLVLSPQEVTEQFTEDGPVPNLKEMLGKIQNEKDRKIFESFLKTGMMDVDVSAEHRAVFSGAYFISDIVSDVDNPDKQIMKTILLACVDAGDQIGNNSAFMRARNLVINRTLVQPEGFNPKRGTKLMDVALNMNRDKVSDSDKLNALEDAIKYSTWASSKYEEFTMLREMEDSEDWRMANFLMKEDVTQMPDENRKVVKEYFEKLLKESKRGDSGATKKLEIFRSLADGFETNEVWSRFTQYHDLSVYGTSVYWSSGDFAINPFKRREIINLPTLRKELNVDPRSNGDAKEFAQAIVKLMSIPKEKMSKRLRREQNARLMMCPSCYGESAGVKVQQKIQESGGMARVQTNDEIVEIIKNKKIEWAMQMYRM